ncbi:hypothetical protein D3C87_660620 [compost metagenome]
MRRAPPISALGSFSSAGWKISFTVPGSCAFIEASTSATPMRIATWPSCPQACITSTVAKPHWARALEAKGTSTCSFTGSASMSARSATTGPGLPPRSVATTPVTATPSRTS